MDGWLKISILDVITRDLLSVCSRLTAKIRDVAGTLHRIGILLVNRNQILKRFSSHSTFNSTIPSKERTETKLLGVHMMRDHSLVILNYLLIINLSTETASVSLT